MHYWFTKKMNLQRNESHSRHTKWFINNRCQMVCSVLQIQVWKENRSSLHRHRDRGNRSWDRTGDLPNLDDRLLPSLDRGVAECRERRKRSRCFCELRPKRRLRSEKGQQGHSSWRKALTLHAGRFNPAQAIGPGLMGGECFSSFFHGADRVA